LPGQFTGTGDICAALWLALTADMDEMQNKNNESSLKQKLEQLAGTMNAIVQRTHQSSVIKLQKEGISSLDAKDEATRKKIVRSREMKLIQSAGDILNPPSTRFQAVRVSER
jgi:pyridoxal/pyridoxine/pyridoxamine kinase